MHPDKSLGSDVRNPGFCQNFWNELGDEVFHSTCSWLELSSFPLHLNDTNIVLATKGDHSGSIKDMRPISLCNVIFKIISKVLANRLHPLIGKFISQEQVAFIPTWSIMDNTLSTFKILHHMRCKHKGKPGEVALKLDISKAFDSVSWSYLKAVMKKMGFNEKLISWMMMCITSVE